MDVIEVAEVTGHVKKLTATTTGLSTADVQFVATLLQDLANATSSTDDIIDERMVEQEVSLWTEKYLWLKQQLRPKMSICR